jgi:quercetin dioxygenase-like cupin family protein
MRTSIWRNGEFLTLVVLAALVIVGGSPWSAHAQGAGPTVIAQTALPVTVNGGDYALVQVILEFAPGAGIPRHAHGGPVVATVLAGEITLQESGTERTLKAGESWSKQPGAPHAAFNRGSEVLRVSVSFLLPKGAEATTVLPQ